MICLQTLKLSLSITVNNGLSDLSNVMNETIATTIIVQNVCDNVLFTFVAKMSGKTQIVIHFNIVTFFYLLFQASELQHIMNHATLHILAFVLYAMPVIV